MQYIPGKSAGELFTEAFNPYLQMMAQAMLKKRMEEQQQPYEIQKALISGGMAQPFTPQMTQGAPLPIPQAQERWSGITHQPNMPSIPSSMPFLQKAQSQYTRPDFIAGNIPFQYMPNIESKLKQVQLDKATAEAEQIRSFMGGKAGEVFGFKPKSINVGGVTYERKETSEDIAEEERKEKRKEIIKGVTGEVAGRVALANESIKNIQDIRKTLFPEGTPESFKRITAFASNLPGGTAPLIGAILPERGWGKAEQNVYRKMGAALSGRQLIQTGVAARPEETAKLVAQFAPSGGSNPQSAWEALNELESFYNSYLKLTDPELRFGANANKGKTSSGMGYTVGE